MIQKNYNSFLEEEVHHGVVVFTSDGCEICSLFEKDLKNYDTANWVIVEVSKDEEFILQKVFNVGGFPFTIVFVNNNVGLIKRGALFQKQMNEIFSFMKTNNIKTAQHITSPKTSYTPVVISFPHNNNDYKVKAFSDSISRGESPIEFCTMYSSVLDENNPLNMELIRKLSEFWSALVNTSIIYVDEGVDENMLNEIMDATAYNRHVEFRKIYDN